MQIMRRRNRTFMLLMAMLTLSTSWAASINETQARNIATRFMASHAMPATSLRMAHKAPLTSATTSGENAYYVFNSTYQGYIIVAGDDRAPAVLAYSDKGTFDPANVPEAMQYMLEGYAAQIQDLKQYSKPAAPVMAGPAIAPLVSAAWSQNSPYNILLPIINGKHAVVGCAATALAQVMYYWKWPARPSMTIPAYTTSDLGIAMPALEPVDFDWDNMRDTYQTSDSTSVQALAAATLSKYCAQALEMNFKDGTSGATTTRSPQMLTNYFGYKASAHTVSRTNCTTQEWAELIYAELAAGRPVIYSGSKKSSGHAFVCDGYDGEGMFHINWGWNGQSNGYFVLNVLNPDVQGTGSASGGYGYIYKQSVIVGIEPGEGTNEFALTAVNVSLGNITTTRSSSDADFSATVTAHFYNYTSQPLAVSYGWGLYQGETLLSVAYNTSYSNLRPGFYMNASDRTAKFGSGLTSGTYRLVPIYSEYSANNWRPCLGVDKNYIEVVIDGNSCTATGHGTVGTPDYTINDITVEGNMHNGRPVDIGVNMTNNGESQNVLLYMFVNGTFTATGFVGMAKGETDVIPFRFMPSQAGDYTLTFSFNDDGSDPIATRTITITEMPEASLSATIEVLNITDAENKIITSDKFSIILTVTNIGTEVYHEDISLKLFKNTYGTTGSNVQAKNQLIELLPGESTSLQFDMDNVVDGWKYFVSSYYYSKGTQTSLKKSTSYTIVFPTLPEFIPGDVNNDGEVDIADVTTLIDYLLNNSTTINSAAADVDASGSIDIADVTSLIDTLLN